MDDKHGSTVGVYSTEDRAINAALTIYKEVYGDELPDNEDERNEFLADREEFFETELHEVDS